MTTASSLASSLERTGDLSLYGTISMSLVIGLLAGLIILALLDRGGDNSAPAIAPLLAAARADQLRRSVVLGTPTDEHPVVTRMDMPPRGQGITVDTHMGRHRRFVEVEVPSLATMGLNEAMARLAVDRVKRDAQRAQFQALLSQYC